MKMMALIRSLVLLASLGAFAADTACGQAARRGSSSRRAAPAATPAQAPAEDDAVKTVDLGDRKTSDGTASGEREGLGDVPEMPRETDKEQSGLDSLSLIPSLSGGRLDAAREAHTSTRPSARTMALLIPAPRGPILDRHGEPLAVTQVAYQLALRFEIFENPDRSRVVEFARNCLEQAEKIAGKAWTFSDDQFWKHYEHRRWLPLPLTNVIRAEDAEKLKDKVKNVRGLQLMPIYIRYYPEKSVAGHIGGYVGSRGKLPTGPINHMDPLFEQVEGRAGLEKEFNKALTGTPGVWRLMFDEDGNKILDELQIRPKPGGAVVTTLNLKWQRDAERILSRGKRRGAMVVLDCVTGEILVMASTPSYDPNLFIPNISQKDYDALRNDPAGPLGARAFQGRYPPASTFKVMTVASALKNRKITEDSVIDCPASIPIGNHVFKNWSKVPPGPANCVRALAMSNNPFMYQMGLRLGAEALMDTARAFGLGERTGLPLPDDPGLVPTSEYMIRNYKRDFMPGDAANLSIGQGPLLATPLQVAHMMAGVANGYLPRLQLIKQIQDGNSNVVYAPRPQEVQRPLPDYEKALASVRKGMKAVIEGGTGGRARLSYSSIAGKSGTAQWGPEREDKRLAWFAGFMPYENPRFAYVVLHEGRPHETLGGGAVAAPIVKEFFELEKKDIKAIIDPPKDDIPVAEPVEETSATEAAAIREQGRVPAVVPDNLPPGLYDPEGMEPIKVHEIPADLDDSSDAEIKATPVGGVQRSARRTAPPLSEDPSAAPLAPQRGDSDYIPGLPRQIPRHLNHTVPVTSPAPRAPMPADDIPMAEPL